MRCSAVSRSHISRRPARLLFRPLADEAAIEHRCSFLGPSNLPDAPGLAQAAVERLALGGERDRITHLLITCCTGFSAPGLDLELVERTMIGFMGCYAAINALKLALHVVSAGDG